jgi:N-acetylneuraminic acid mutarotase
MRKILLNALIIIPILLLTNAKSYNWEFIDKMPHPVYGGQALVLDSLIYILGGYSDSLSGPTNIIQTYDPNTNIWSEAGTMIESRHNFVAAKLDDSSIVTCGGVWMNTDNIFSIEIINAGSDGVDNAEIIKHDINFNRTYFTGHVYNNRLYLFGGYSQFVADTTVIPFIVNFDLSTESVAAVKDSLYQSNLMLYHHTSERIDSMVYIFGGIHNAVSRRVSTFNLNSYEYETVGELKGVRAGGKAVTLGNEIYIIGGYNETSKALKSVEIYNTRLNASYIGSNLNFHRDELMAVVYNNSIYIFGGKDEYSRSIPWIEKLDLNTTTGFDQNNIKTVEQFRLYNSYPNPFNANAVIRFDVGRAMNLSLDMYSISGEHIKKIVASHFAPGNYKYNWDGKDKMNNPVASGIYIYRLHNSSMTDSKKMILVR